MRNLIVLTLLFISISGVARAVPYQKFDQLPDSLQSALKKHSQATLNLYFVSGVECNVLGYLLTLKGEHLLTSIVSKAA